MTALELRAVMTGRPFAQIRMERITQVPITRLRALVAPGSLTSATISLLNVSLHRRRGFVGLGAMRLVSAHVQAEIMAGFAQSRKAVLAGLLPIIYGGTRISSLV